VEEYYQYDPDRDRLRGWRREGDQLREILPIEGWISPRLGIRLEMEAGELVIYRPDGERFQTYLEMEQDKREERCGRLAAEARTEQEQQRANEERQRAEQERQRANEERQRANEERLQREAAQQRAEQEQQRAEQERQQRQTAQTQAEQERQRAEQLAAKLRALGIDPEA